MFLFVCVTSLYELGPVVLIVEAAAKPDIAIVARPMLEYRRIEVLIIICLLSRDVGTVYRSFKPVSIRLVACNGDLASTVALHGSM